MRVSIEKERISVRAAQNEDELRAANDMMIAVLGRETALRPGLDSAGAGFRGYLLEHTRIAVRRDGILAALRIFSETIRLGEARLKVGGLGPIAEAPEQRADGIAATLVEDAMRYLASHGYHLALAFGPAMFYRRLGFATVLPEYRITMHTVDAACILPDPYRSRATKPGDIGALQRIHAANDVNVPCSLLRTQAHLKIHWDDWKACDVLIDEQGKVLGYLVFGSDGDPLAIREVGVADDKACRCVLAAAAQRAAQEGAGKLSFALAPQHPMAHFLLRFPSSHETDLTRDSGAMLALLNVPETLENLIPEWESRIVSKAARDVRLEFTCVVDDQPYRIRANRGAIDVAATGAKNKLSVSSGQLLDLITGCVYAEDVLNAQPRLITADARELIAALFPKRNPFIWPQDRF